MFTFEGAAYDIVAAAVGAILGAIVAYGMVFLMARAFDADEDLQISVHRLHVAAASSSPSRSA